MWILTGCPQVVLGSSSLQESSTYVPKVLQQLAALQPLPDDLPALMFGGSVQLIVIEMLLVRRKRTGKIYLVVLR